MNRSARVAALLGVVTLSSFVSARSASSGAFGTVVDFPASAFCQRWACHELQRHRFGASGEYTNVDYRLDDDAVVSVTLLSGSGRLDSLMVTYQKRAFASVVVSKGKYQTYMPDLVKWATGASGTVNLYQDCIQTLNRLGSSVGSPHTFGRSNVYCMAGLKGLLGEDTLYLFLDVPKKP